MWTTGRTLTIGRGAQMRASEVKRAQEMSNHCPVGCTGHPQAQTRMPHLESDHPRQMGENGCSDSYCSGLQNIT